MQVFNPTELLSQWICPSSAWSVGLSPVHSKLSIASHEAKLSQSESTIYKGSASGRSLGIAIHGSFIYQRHRRYALVFENSLMHSRRKGNIEESKFYIELIEKKQGELKINNLYLQSALAPRIYFGSFKRIFIQAGMYFELNLLNFSKFSGDQIRYYDIIEEGGSNSILAQLPSPTKTSFVESKRVKPYDFGGIVGSGFMISLPGKDAIQVEIRYTRGAFNLSEIPGIRQNRIQMVLSYNILKCSLSKDYRIH